MDSQQNQQLNVFDLQRIRAQTGIRNLQFHEQINSTNDEAIRCVSSDSNPCPVVVLTDYQKAGRGQRDRVWNSEPGSLTFSLGLDIEDIDTSKSLIPLSVGVSVCQAVQRLSSSPRVQIKWPNDIIVDQKKAGGILIESVGANRVVIGVGLNVNNPIREKGPDRKRLLKAISIGDAFGKPVALTELVINCLNEIRGNLSQSDSDQLTRAGYERLSFLSNHHIEIELPDGTTMSGLCQGIDTGGSLLLLKEPEFEASMKIASGRIRRIENPNSGAPD